MWNVLRDPPSAQQVDHQHDSCDNKEHVQKSTERVAADEPEGPEN